MDIRALAGMLGMLCLTLVLVPAARATDQIRVVVAYPPGASLDTLARSFGEQLRLVTGSTVVVENKAGANGTLGAQTVAQAAPDGKTLLVAGDTIVTVNPVLYPKTSFGIDKLEPIGTLAFQSSILAVRADAGPRTVADFIAAAKRKEITYSSAGPGSSGHLVMSKLVAASGIKAVHVPYKGGAPAILALLSGEVDAAFLAGGNVLPYVQQGKLRALAVSSAARLPSLPDVPTMQEAGFKDFVVRNANIVLAPKGMDAAVKRQLEDQIARARAAKAFQETLAGASMESADLDAAQTVRWLQTEGGRWKQIIRQNGIKVE